RVPMGRRQGRVQGRSGVLHLIIDSAVIKRLSSNQAKRLEEIHNLSFGMEISRFTCNQDHIGQTAHGITHHYGRCSARHHVALEVHRWTILEALETIPESVFLGFDAFVPDLYRAANRPIPERRAGSRKIDVRSC
ncbi:hypothetical protein, partial [Burkholderia multivorans]|uniref:hypothetical protein n=1 Tax=Burkholderia multivorans TaxID=87883 RepID=UPI001C61571C